MAYLTYFIDASGKVSEDIITGGYTRHQVLNGLSTHGLHGYNEALPPLPRFGKVLVVAKPAPQQSFVIRHI